MARLRVLSFNIHHGANAANRLNLPAIADVIESAHPDVVCLQEVDCHYGPRSAHADQCNELAERLEMHSAYGPSVVRGEQKYGNALLAGAELANPSIDFLPTRKNQEPRSVLSADLHTDAGTIRVASTHFGAGQKWRDVRRAQADALVDLVFSWSSPAVIGGDFNSAKPSEELASLQKLRSTGPVRRSPRQWGRWWQRPEGATFPVAWPRFHLDRVYFTGDATVTRYRVVPALVSDHRPLLVELQFLTRGLQTLEDVFPPRF